MYRREQVVISKVKKPDIVAEHPAETNGVEATDVEGTESIVDEE